MLFRWHDAPYMTTVTARTGLQRRARVARLLAKSAMPSTAHGKRPETPHGENLKLTTHERCVAMINLPDGDWAERLQAVLNDALLENDMMNDPQAAQSVQPRYKI